MREAARSLRRGRDDFGTARVLKVEADGCCLARTIFIGSNAGRYITATI
jgi:hypothetical protein